MGRSGRGGMSGGRSGSGRVGGSNRGGGRVGVGGRGRGQSGRAGRGGANPGGRNGGYGGYGGYGRPRGYGGYGRTYRRPFFGGFGFPYYRRRRGCGLGGCFVMPGCFVTLLVIALFAVMSWTINLFSRPMVNDYPTAPQSEITTSTKDREPIDSGLVIETDYYTDQLNWVENDTVLLDGMSYFYKQTNVQPHLYITDNIDGNENPSFEELEEYADQLYDDLFRDEAHSLLLFFENENYDDFISYHISTGSQAQMVMDQEANDILFDHLDYYYYNDMPEGQYFSIAYRETADKIMATQTNYRGIFMVVLGVIVVLIILYMFWKNLLSKDTKKKKEHYDPNTDRRIVGEDDDDDLDY